MKASPRRRTLLLAALVGIGALWGLTMPVTKIAVSTGYRPFGLIFWQLALACVILGAMNLARGRGLPRGRRDWSLALFVAVVGTLAPNSTSYRAAAELPAGVMAIAVAAVPLFALPIGVALGQDRFSIPRIAGIALGLFGVALIALPQASLPDPAMALFLPLALVAPFAYACEANGVSWLGGARLDPITLLLGASLIGLVLITPVSLATGQFIPATGAWSAQKSAIVLNAALHALAYCSYLWLIGAGGAVFAAQVAYLVTGFGVVWSMTFLGETYSVYIWLALLAVLAGIALVQPRDEAAEA